jgi:aldose 1-epimerase
MRLTMCLLMAVWGASGLMAGEITIEKDTSTGWAVYTLAQGDTTIQVVPAAGANVKSILHNGAEYFHQPTELKDLPGVGHGNPILYPTPNRIKGASFDFEGKTYDFPKGGSGNHIHGLVHSEAFEVESTQVETDFASITCRLNFEPGTRQYEIFPWTHTFRMKTTVRDGSVRWDYEVDNDKSGRNLPFGVAFHPYIVYQNSRKATFLRVPATALMESFSQLPSGKLLELERHPLDARTFTSLEGFNSDDVFIGIVPENSAKVEFRDVNRSITFKASKEFTHLVVWTPDRPYMGIENQTCSTDAHNLDSSGAGEVAHLQICPPGEKRSGTVEYVLD